MLALNSNGLITECRATVIGRGRCNHIMHQKDGQSTKDFIKQVNAMTDSNNVPVIRNKFKTPYRNKNNLSGNFRKCTFVKKDNIEAITKKLETAKETLHNTNDRQSRNEKLEQYEKDFPGKTQDMFIVDRGHTDGNELHVIKNNGIIDIYNVDKYHNGENCFITSLIARPKQIDRYYKFNDCYTPQYLKDIAYENELNNRNNW